MKDISISEAYFLYAVQKKGKIFGYDTLKTACLMASVLYEMKQSGVIDISGHKVMITGSVPDDAPYFAPVYEHLREIDLPDFKHILQDYSNSLSDRHLNALTTPIGTRLAEQGLATKAKLGLFGGRIYFMPYKDAIPALTAELQVNILYQTPVPTADGFLWMLLEKSSCIPGALPEDQRAVLSRRVAAALQNEANEDLAEPAQLMDHLLAAAKTTAAFIGNYE